MDYEHSSNYEFFLIENIFQIYEHFFRLLTFFQTINNFQAMNIFQTMNIFNL
jgi:hypothetical protein